MKTELHSRILNFMNQHPLAVISTLNSVHHKPESALVAFAQTPQLEIIFETWHCSRKYKNLQHNSKVAFVMGWDESIHITLQYEGLATKIAKDKLPIYQQIFLAKKTPCTQAFLFHPKARLWLVTPLWIRYSDYTTCPATICEWNNF